MEENRKIHANMNGERLSWMDERSVDRLGGRKNVIENSMWHVLLLFQCNILLVHTTHTHISNKKKRVILCFYEDLQMVCGVHCVAHSYIPFTYAYIHLLCEFQSMHSCGVCLCYCALYWISLSPIIQCIYTCLLLLLLLLRFQLVNNFGWLAFYFLLYSNTRN